MIKKIIALFILLIFQINLIPAFAINIGTYQTESEYGLLDGFKFNWKKKDKSQPFVELREESTKKEREKEKREIKENEYQYTKYMYEGKAVF